VHFGLPKTGTSYLQSLVWGNLAELRQQGLVVVPDPGPTAQGKPGADVMLAARGRLKAGRDPLTAEEVLDRLASEVAAAGDADVLLTQEQLVGCTRRQVRSLLERFGDREVHVVATARAVSRQVPSAWQERVKTRSTTAYGDFLDAVRDRTDEAKGFWRNQDLPAALGRWGHSLPSGQVHVVTVPAASGSGELAARFFGVLGVDHTRLQAGETRSNSSLGAVQAELLRRVNLALGGRLPKPRLGYDRVGRWFLADRFLVPQAGRPPLLPPSAQEWCRRLGEDWATSIREAGYDVVGDLADLLPDPAHFAEAEAAYEEAALLDSATRALADILAFRHEELGRIDALHARVAELEAQVAAQADEQVSARESTRPGRSRGPARWRGRR
jgi:uncharacterized coiled-coil protein SlyX